MSRKTKSVFVCILFFIVNGCSPDVRPTYTASSTSPGDGFSYVPPENWIMREVPGQKYKLAVGQPVEGFTPNINVLDEHFPGTLDEYVAANLQVMPQMYEKMGIKNLRVLSQSEFTTDQNQRGFRFITESESEGKKTRQTFYFFDGKNSRKFVVTCTVPVKVGESYDKLFEASMKTFKTTT